MTEDTQHRIWLAAAVSTALVSLLVVMSGAVKVGVGIFAGGTWNMASLWCLARLLSAWLGPAASRRRVIGWLLVKFPLLYLVVFTLLRHPAVSLVGFGIGFTIVLVVALGALIVSVRRPPLARADGH